MTKITLDSQLVGRLSTLDEPAELCDDSGHVLGQFFPSRVLQKVECRDPEIDQQEIARRLQSTEWFSTAEVLERLERLP